MRQLILFGAALVLVVQGAGQVRADKVEVKGPHICCVQCVRIAEGLLNKVEGVSEAKADIKSKAVSFTATDEKAAKAGIRALVDGGFFGVATSDGSKDRRSQGHRQEYHSSRDQGPRLLQRLRESHYPVVSVFQGEF
jgi:copper chaperone CopZ